MFEISNIMTTDVITVHTQTPINEAIEILINNNITGLPVVNKDRSLIGIISEKDIMKLLYSIGGRPGKVKDFMTKDVVAFDVSDSIADVCDCLLYRHFRRVPILDNGKLVAFIVS